MSKLEFGIFLDLATDSVSVADQIEIYRELVAVAEDGGFTSVWGRRELPPWRPGLSQHVPSPMLVLAALSGSTSMRLGTGVTLLPVWDPLRLAYDATIPRPVDPWSLRARGRPGGSSDVETVRPRQGHRG